MIPHDDFSSDDRPRLGPLGRGMHYLLAGLLGFYAAITLFGFIDDHDIVRLFVSLMFATWSWGMIQWGKYRRIGLPSWHDVEMRRATLIMLAAVVPVALALLWREHHG